MDAPIRVLLIEDDPAYPVLLERLFASVPGLILCGVAQDGRLGLELLEQEQVDVVLLDLVMPEMDGLTFLERLRNRPGRPAVVVPLRGQQPADYPTGSGLRGGLLPD